VTERWLVLSPHCDDAVLSLGATIADHVRRSGSVTVVTALPGDVHSDAPASEWDRRAGFGTAGEAARARRQEDLEACEAIGARPVHLDGLDERYGAARDDALLHSLSRLAAEHDVLWVPGAPLAHPDHRRLALRAIDELASALEVRFYGEEPYLTLARRAPRPDDAPVSVTWRRTRPSLAAMRAKARGVGRYRSQLALLTGPAGRDRLRSSPLLLRARLVLGTARGEWTAERSSTTG
jgi:LmbE family N-acetylglucosaminyl deacetylase